MLPRPQATSTDHGGSRTSDLSIERRRRNHFIAAPHIVYAEDIAYGSALTINEIRT